MLTLKTIQKLFSEFCVEWNYSIENYDERTGLLLLKQKKYSVSRDSYIFIDLVNRVIRSYSTILGKSLDLFSDCLLYEEIRDLILVLTLVYKKLDMEE